MCYWATVRYDRVYCSLDYIVEYAIVSSTQVKFFDNEGFLKGTAYPDGTVQW